MLEIARVEMTGCWESDLQDLCLNARADAYSYRGLSL